MSEENFVSKLKDEIDVVERHLKILDIIIKEGPIGIIKLSEKTHLPPHKVRYSLRVLESNGLIKPSANGAMITEKTEEFINDFENIIQKIAAKIKSLEKLFAPR